MAEKYGSVNGWKYNSKPEAVSHVNDIRKMYGLDNMLLSIDWLFPIIEPEEGETEYWNNVADQILNAGTTDIEIWIGSKPVKKYQISDPVKEFTVNSDSMKPIVFFRK
jgi:hypothetical protein